MATAGTTPALANGVDVLVLEDDAKMLSLLREGLAEEGFDVRVAASGSDALNRVDERVPDLLVVDIGLPDSDGRDVCQALRARGVWAPVLFLTARSTVTDRLSGFGAGGDDYLVKPFVFPELVARLKALARRKTNDATGADPPFRLDPARHSVSEHDVEIMLTPTEYRVLARLTAAGGEAVRRSALVEAGWSHGAFVRDNTLDSFMARLRRKLVTLPGSVPTITTVRGVGYALR